MCSGWRLQGSGCRMLVLLRCQLSRHGLPLLQSHQLGYEVAGRRGRRAMFSLQHVSIHSLG